MDLKGYAEVGTEIEESSLIFNVKVENKSKASTAETNHTRCFVVGFSYVSGEVILHI